MDRTKIPDLGAYSNTQFRRGRSVLVEMLWIFAQWLLVSSWLPGSAHRRWLLRMFGAEIADRVVLKPRLRIKFPWKLKVGQNTWIGEGVWIDNLDTVHIGDNCCISQGAFLCGGSHDWSSADFALLTKPITLGDGAWICARAIVAPGVTIGEGAVVGIGSVATRNMPSWTVSFGIPAIVVKSRVIENR